MTTLGQKLTYLRKTRKPRAGHKCTLQYVSDFTELSVSYISDLEHDRTEPSIKTLKTLAKFYHVKPSYLIDDESDYEITEGR